MLKMERGYYWAFHKDGTTQVVEVSEYGTMYICGDDRDWSPGEAYDEMFIDYLVGPISTPFVMHRDGDLFGLPDKSFMKMYRMEDLKEKYLKPEGGM